MQQATEFLQRVVSDISQTNSKTSSNIEPPTAEQPRHTRGGDPNCPHCGGSGFVMPDVSPSDARFGRATPCTCRMARTESQRGQKLLAMSQLGLLQNCTFENFMADGVGLTPTKQHNLRFVYNQVRTYAADPQGWLVLRGGYGAGKTHLAAAIANGRIQAGHPALFVNMPDLLDYLRAAFSPAADQGYDQRFDEIRNTPLLILDDFGAQHNTEWVQEKLYQLFNYRYTAQLPTVITTNEELEAIDIRIRSRMADSTISQILTLLAPDYRRAGAEEQSELSTLGLHTDKSFDSFDLRDHELPRAEANNLRRAFDLAQGFAANPEGWLVFNGVYGNGKTHLAAAIANAVARVGDAEALFVVVPDLLDHLRAAFSPTSATPYDKRFAEVKTAALLVLDDLGTESATPWAREKLYQLFNYRYNARLPTVITTAVPPDELDPRLASRMLDGDRCTFFVLEAPSYRGGGKGARRRKK